MRSEPLPPVWVAVGLDPITESVSVLGFARTVAESKVQQTRAGADGDPFRCSFLFTGDGFAEEFYRWLVHCKVPRREAENIIRTLGNEVCKMLDTMPG